MRLAVLVYLTLAATLAGCASAPTPHEAFPGSSAMKDGSLRVLGHRCDGDRGVDTLVLHVDTPGKVIVHWSNRNACGDPA